MPPFFSAAPGSGSAGGPFFAEGAASRPGSASRVAGASFTPESATSASPEASAGQRSATVCLPFGTTAAIEEVLLSAWPRSDFASSSPSSTTPAVSGLPSSSTAAVIGFAAVPSRRTSNLMAAGPVTLSESEEPLPTR